MDGQSSLFVINIPDPPEPIVQSKTTRVVSNNKYFSSFSQIKDIIDWFKSWKNYLGYGKEKRVFPIDKVLYAPESDDMDRMWKKW